MGNSQRSATSVRPADLTEPNIKNAQAGDLLRDETLPGLHLRAFDGRKSFYLYFRTKTGQERRPKLGDYGVITLSKARQIAKEMLGQVATGGDPIAVREGARKEPTLQNLWDEYWKRHGCKKKSGDEDKRKWETDIKGKFGSCKLSVISYTDMADFHEALSEDAPVAANRTMALLSKMFSFAHRPLQWFSGVNPCKGVARNKEKKRKRKATREELARLVKRLRAELEGPNVSGAAFLWLLLMTGARKGEIATCRWDNVHGNRILLDEHKTDEGGYDRIILLPQAALDIINKYLKPAKLQHGHRTITGILSPKTLWDTIREEEKLVHAGVYLNMHDLRRTFASVALSNGATLEQVMQMLGHTSAQTSKVYAHLMEDTAGEVVNSVADRILA